VGKRIQKWLTRCPGSRLNIATTFRIEDLRQMKNDQFTVLVERRLKIRTLSDGKEADLVIRIGMPRVIEANGDAVCPVSIDGLFGRLPDIRGIDEMDALRSAIELVEKSLRGRTAEEIMWPDGQPYL
jgi:hypothetical protein